jgi:hypothetical protein
VRLTSGDLTATFQDGWLRWVTYGGREVLRGIYVALRDTAWTTPVPDVREIRMVAGADRMSVQFDCDLRPRGIPVHWEGSLEMTSDGELSYAIEAVADAAVAVGRFGICVMQPPSLAGQSISVSTPTAQRIVNVRRRIDASRATTDLTGMSWQVSKGVRAEVQFEGDLFELEDQRNWTDASFKTFNRPLHLPWPYILEPEARVRQVVRLRVTGPVSRRHAAARPLAVEVHESNVPLPLLGTSWPHALKDGSGEIARKLTALRLGHLRVELDLGAGDWRGQFTAAGNAANAAHTGLHVHVTAGSDESRLAELAEALCGAIAPVSAVFVFHPESVATSRSDVARARKALSGTGLQVALGGGSRQSFFELNRTNLRTSLLDGVVFPISPLAHELDRSSMAETLAIQGRAVRQAIARSRGRQVAVAPVTLQPLAPTISPAPGRSAPPNALQPSPFAAAWMAGSIRALASAGAASATYFDAAGLGGLMDDDSPSALTWLAPGAVFPTYHVLRFLAGASRILDLRIDQPAVGPPTLEAVAVRGATGTRLILANLTATAQNVCLSLPGHGPAHIARLDSGSASPLNLDAGWLDRKESWSDSDADNVSVPGLAVALLVRDSSP